MDRQQALQWCVGNITEWTPSSKPPYGWYWVIQFDKDVLVHSDWNPIREKDWLLTLPPATTESRKELEEAMNPFAARVGAILKHLTGNDERPVPTRDEALQWCVDMLGMWPSNTHCLHILDGWEWWKGVEGVVLYNPNTSEIVTEKDWVLAHPITKHTTATFEEALQWCVDEFDEWPDHDHILYAPLGWEWVTNNDKVLLCNHDIKISIGKDGWMNTKIKSNRTTVTTNGTNVFHDSDAEAVKLLERFNLEVLKSTKSIHPNVIEFAKWIYKELNRESRVD